MYQLPKQIPKVSSAPPVQMEGNRKTTQRTVITGLGEIDGVDDFARTIVAEAAVDVHSEDWVDLC